MVEGRGLPGVNGMALRTICALAAFVRIIGLVTANTSCWRAGEQRRRGMALFASHSRMPTRQLKNGIMLKRRSFPIQGGVTILASLAFTAVVHIILLMATHASCRSLPELAGRCVATLASHNRMPPIERKTGGRVLKQDFLPVLLVVARLTGYAQGFAMRVVLQMTIHAPGG